MWGGGGGLPGFLGSPFLGGETDAPFEAPNPATFSWLQGCPVLTVIMTSLFLLSGFLAFLGLRFKAEVLFTV